MKEYGNLLINSVIPLLISGISTVGGIWGATIQAKKYEDSKQSKVESYQKILEIIEPINALYILIEDSRWADARNACFGGALDDLENKLQSGTYVLLVPKEVLKSTKIILNEMVEIVNLENRDQVNVLIEHLKETRLTFEVSLEHQAVIIYGGPDEHRIAVHGQSI